MKNNYKSKTEIEGELKNMGLGNFWTLISIDCMSLQNMKGVMVPFLVIWNQNDMV